MNPIVKKMKKNIKHIIGFAIVAVLLSACGTTHTIADYKPEVDPKTGLTEKQSLRLTNLFFEASKEKLLGNFNKARTIFGLCLQIDPNNDAVLYELSQIERQIGEFELAEAKLKKAISIQPNNIWYKRALLDIYESTSKFEEASELYYDLEKETPYDIELYYNHAYSLIKMSKLKEAIKVYNKVEEAMGISEEISIQKQRIYLNLGELDNAVIEIEKLIESDPTNPKHYQLLAEMYAANGKTEEAKKAYEKLLEISPESGEGHLALADFYLMTGDFKKAQIERIAAFKSQDIDIDKKVKTLLKYYPARDTTTVKHGYQLCEALIETHPKEAKAYTIYGDFLYRDDSLKLAQSMYRKAVSYEQSKFPVWNQLLVIDNQLEEYKAMQDDADKAMEFFPNQPLLYLFKGLASIRLKEYEKAATIFESGKDLVIDNDELLSEFYSNIGESYYQAKNYKKSDESFEKAIALVPNNALVLNNYSYYLSLRKDSLEKAEKYSALSNKISPNNASFLDTYGWIMYQQGKFAEAKEWLQKAVEAEGGENAVIIEHLGDAVWQLGKKKEAVKLWEKAKQKGEGSEMLDKKIADKQLYE